jgi:tartrate-resistant acid phosphatase type 5
MINRRTHRYCHLDPRGRFMLVTVILAFLFLFEFDFPASPSTETGSDSQGGISFRTSATSPIQTVEQDGRKKKKSDDDDDDSEGTRVINARPAPPFTIPPAVPGKRYAYFIAIGDWGAGSRAQQHVAELMNAKAGRDSLHFVLLLGDNFYEKGVKSVDDPQWEKKFESMYNLPFLNVPFFASLGNHDYRTTGSPEAEVEYAKRNTKWKMPARFYTFTRNIDQAAAIQFFVLDTEAIVAQKTRGAVRDQIKWLKSELAKSQATWKIVFGHHPVFSNGDHGDTPEIKHYIRPLLEKYHVDFYICGHDHDRQLLQPVAGVNYVVSGSAAKSRDTRWANNTIFAASDLGFTWFRVSADEFHVQFINKNGEIEFAYTVNKIKPKAGGKAADKE